MRQHIGGSDDLGNNNICNCKNSNNSIRSKQYKVILDGRDRPGPAAAALGRSGAHGFRSADRTPCAERQQSPMESSATQHPPTSDGFGRRDHKDSDAPARSTSRRETTRGVVDFDTRHTETAFPDFRPLKCKLHGQGHGRFPEQTMGRAHRRWRYPRP